MERRHLTKASRLEPLKASISSCRGEASGIPCLWFPAPKAATVILFFHANAEDLGMSFAVLRHIRDQFKALTVA